jgi:hypothetical protein
MINWLCERIAAWSERKGYFIVVRDVRPEITPQKRYVLAWGRNWALSLNHYTFGDSQPHNHFWPNATFVLTGRLVEHTYLPTRDLCIRRVSTRNLRPGRFVRRGPDQGPNLDALLVRQAGEAADHFLDRCWDQAVHFAGDDLAREEACCGSHENGVSLRRILLTRGWKRI